MKVIFAPLVTAVVLVDALTYNPYYYANNAEATGVVTWNAEPRYPQQASVEHQNIPSNDKDIEPPSTEAVETKHNISEQPDDIDESNYNDEEFDTKPTPTEFIDANQTPKPTPPGVKINVVDDDLNKPAGIDFPDGKSTEKEFDHVTIMTTTDYTTSTVYSTVTSTITDCVSTVTDCAEKGSVVTKTISLYTTICPVTTATPTGTQTPVAPPSDELDDEDSDSPESDEPESDKPESDEPESNEPESDKLESDEPESDEPELDEPESETPNKESPESELESDLEPDTESDSDIPDAPEPTQGPYLTKTIETTVWYTVTDCAPKETDCPVGQQTSSISTLTEIYPVTDIPHFWSPNSTQTQPYATSSPSSYPEPPQTNVTVTTTPQPHFTINAGSAKKANGLLMGFGLITASAIALLQGWY